jgi:hypothetical protein
VGQLAGALGALVATVLIVVGAVTLGFNSARDSSGYLSSGTTRYTTPAYALATKSYEAGSFGDRAVPAGLLGKVRVQVHSDAPVFVGIARTSDVSRYLKGVAHMNVTGVDAEDIDMRMAGDARPADPVTQSFSVASSTGRGVQNLKWHAHSGHWRAVVMNTDGSRDVSAGVALGAEMPHLGRSGLIALLSGLALGAAAGLMIRAGLRR